MLVVALAGLVSFAPPADGHELELRAGLGLATRSIASSPPPPGRARVGAATAVAIAASFDIAPRDQLRFRFGCDFASTIAGTMRERTGVGPTRSVRVRSQSLGAQALTIGRIADRGGTSLWLGAGPRWSYEPLSSPVHPATPIYAMHLVGVDVPVFLRVLDDRVELGAAPSGGAAFADARARNVGMPRLGWSLGGQAWIRVRISRRLGAVLQWRGRYASFGGDRVDALHVLLLGLSLRAKWS